MANEPRAIETFEYAFSRQQVQNMIIFMNRSKLDGQEVPAFNDIMAVLHNQPNAKPFQLKLMECDRSILVKELERRQLEEEKRKQKEEALLAANKLETTEVETPTEVVEETTEDVVEEVELETTDEVGEEKDTE